jgi:hypothetical protein
MSAYLGFVPEIKRLYLITDYLAYCFNRLPEKVDFHPYPKHSKLNFPKKPRSYKSLPV